MLGAPVGSMSAQAGKVLGEITGKTLRLGARGRRTFGRTTHGEIS